MRAAGALVAVAVTVLALAGATAAAADDAPAAGSSGVTITPPASAAPPAGTDSDAPSAPRDQDAAGSESTETGTASSPTSPTADTTSASDAEPVAAAATTPSATSTTTPTSGSSTPFSTPPLRDPVAAPDSRRVIVYYQKHYENEVAGTGYISPLPLLTQGTGVDVINLAAIHMNKDPKDPTKAVLNLNDNPPSDPMYTRMWAELHQMQEAGIPVIAMIGGAMNDTWPNLQSDFETQYAQLAAFVRTYRLDGVDLDIELDKAQLDKDLSIDIDTVIRVIDRLRADFGPAFLITSSPVLDEFGPGDPDDPNSDPAPDGRYGVNFNDLYRERGDQIAWFNLQAYCGHGLPTPDYYEEIIDYQQGKGAQIPPEKLVIAALTNQKNCDDGWIPLDELTTGLTELVGRYPTFGGVAGWEYFNSQPGDTARPWEWAALMRAALDADPTPTTTTSTTTSTSSSSSEPTTSSPTPTTTSTSDPFTSAPYVPVDVTPTWTVDPVPAVVPPAAAPTTVTDQRTLAATGVDVLPLTAVGGVSLLLGAAALLSRRRRQTPARR